MIPTILLALVAAVAQPAWADRADPASAGRRAASAPADRDYPPWITRQDGGHAYKPQYMPAPLTGTTRCGNAALARSLGAFYTGPMRDRIAAGEGRTKSTVGGAASGAVVTGAPARRMADADHGCVAEVLELAPVGQRARWESAGVQYELQPGEPQYLQGSYCRGFRLEVRAAGSPQRIEATACRRPDGIWLAH
jgi:surface antigen